MSGVYDAFAQVVGALLPEMNPFRKTSHGPNPWSADGLVGALRIRPHVSTALQLIPGAVFNSVYRSPFVQAAIYEQKRNNPAAWRVVENSARARGVSTEEYVRMMLAGGRHMRGLATDFGPAPMMTVAQLATRLYELALAGKLGPVKKVLDEGDHAHVEWWGPNEQVKDPVLERVA